MSTNHENRSELTKKVKELLSKVLDIEEDEMKSEHIAAIVAALKNQGK